MQTYIQPKWSFQLCSLMEKNLINTLDVMEYADIISGKKLPHFKQATIERVNKLYIERIGEIN